MKELRARFEITRVKVKSAVRRCAAAPRLLVPVFAALAFLLPALSARADAPDFRFRPLLAGKASLTEPGFVVRRELGVAALAPELRIPVELVYESSSVASGAFGFGWRCPQLESSVLRRGRSHMESRRYGGDSGAQGDAPSGAMRGGAAWA